MESIEGIMKEAAIFPNFEPIEVLIECDGPRTFVLRDADDALCLAHWVDENEVIRRFLVAPCRAKTILQLKRGELGLRESLDQARLYCADVRNDGTIGALSLVQLEDVPEDMLPAPGTMLTKNAEPAVRSQ